MPIFFFGAHRFVPSGKAVSFNGVVPAANKLRSQRAHFARQNLRGGLRLAGQRGGDRGMVGVGFVLVELEAAFDLIDRHDQTHDRFLHGLEAARPSSSTTSRAASAPASSSNLALSVVEMRGRVRRRTSPHRAGQMHGLIEPGRHLIRRGVPVRRNIGIGAVHGHQPGASCRRRASPADCCARHETRPAACRHRHS